MKNWINFEHLVQDEVHLAVLVEEVVKRRVELQVPLYDLLRLEQEPVLHKCVYSVEIHIAFIIRYEGLVLKLVEVVVHHAFNQ